MKCNVSHQAGKPKPSKVALIKNKKKIRAVGELGMLHDKLEAQYAQETDEAKRAELKAKMAETAEKIKTMSAEIKAEVYKTKGAKDTQSAPPAPLEKTDITTTESH